MKQILIALITALLITGTGCVGQGKPATPERKTISIGGIATVQIPAHCNGEGAAGSHQITCPTPDNETPIPELIISSDGNQINIRRWENLESPYWNDIISSLRIITPLDRPIQINVDK